MRRVPSPDPQHQRDGGRGRNRYHSPASRGAGWGLVNNFLRNYRATLPNPLNDDLVPLLQCSGRHFRHSRRFDAGFDGHRKLVALARHGHNIGSAVRLRLQCLAEAEDMLGEIALLDKGVEPYSLQQFVFRDYATRIGHQVKQHFKRFRRQWNADTLVQQRACTNPQLEFAEVVDTVRRGHSSHADRSFDSLPVRQRARQEVRVIVQETREGFRLCWSACRGTRRFKTAKSTPRRRRTQWVRGKEGEWARHIVRPTLPSSNRK